MAPRRKCTVCGSHQWHKEPATGLVVCSEGHVLQVCTPSFRYRETPLIVRPRIISMKRSRRKNSVRINYANARSNLRARGEDAPAKLTLTVRTHFCYCSLRRPESCNHTVYYGARAQYLYFQCLQLLLRKQIAALIRLWGLPTEFEVRISLVWQLTREGEEADDRTDHL